MAAGAFLAMVTGSAPVAVAAALALPPLLWTPFAVDVLTAVGNVRVLQWPYLPLVSIRQGLRQERAQRRRSEPRTPDGPAAEYRGVGYSVVMTTKGVLVFLGLLLGVALLGVAVGGLGWLFEFLFGGGDSGKNSGGDKDGQDGGSTDSGFHFTWMWLYIVGGCVGTVLAVLLVRAVGIGVARLVRTRRVERHVRRELSSIEDRLPLTDLMSIVDRAGNDRVIRETVLTLQRRDVFRTSPDAVDFLADMAHTAAENRGTGATSLELAPNCGPHFTQWLTADAGAGTNTRARSRIVRRLTPVSCDVITRMVHSTTR
jgi:hypothetical protein